MTPFGWGISARYLQIEILNQVQDDLLGNMTMPITEDALNHWIKNFYGYGSWEAKIWFVGYEEPSGDMPEEVADKLNYFSKNHRSAENPTLCDIRELYRNVRFTLDRSRAETFTTLHDYRFGGSAVQRGEWKGLISFVHGYRSQPLPDSSENLNYQRSSLAAVKGNEALLRLYPLPAHSHAWYYSWLDLRGIDFLKSRATYQEHVYEGRITSILHQMIDYKPEVVVMYDMAGINVLKESVQQSFPDVQFKSVKAIKRKIPQHHVAELPDTTLVITTQSPGLRHNRVETGFDWEAFGRSLHSQG